MRSENEKRFTGLRAKDVRELKAIISALNAFRIFHNRSSNTSAFPLFLHFLACCGSSESDYPGPAVVRSFLKLNCRIEKMKWRTLPCINRKHRPRLLTLPGSNELRVHDIDD
jgi:hypothetical protein